MYSGQVSSTSVTVEQKPIVNGREVLNKREAANRQVANAQQQVAQRVHQAGYPTFQTTTQVTTVPVPYGTPVGKNTSVTVSHTDTRGNEHSKLLVNATQTPVPSYTVGYPQPQPIYAQPAAVVVPAPSMNNGRAPAAYAQPFGLRKQ